MRAIEITTQIGCTNNCSYCPQNKLVKAYKGNKSLSLSDFDYYLSKIPSSIRIHFSGFCEPYQNKECSNMLIKASFNHVVVLYTTTIGMTNHDIYILKNIASENSIHIPNKSFKHKKLWKENVNKLWISRTSFRFIAVDADEKLLEYAKTLNKEIIYQPLISRGGNIKSIQESFIFGNIKCKDNRHLQGVLLPNGDVVICCMDYSLNWVIGNLHKIEYHELFESDKYKEFLATWQDDKIDTICRQCFRAVNV